ncbi:hypothetical protein BsIDN1_39540 [Bacillus safensis]|uniref:chorismate mutase n=1 Tax=Bacillus safensis TaxID=561879 RepID=A0A5S9MFH1_BACIA|nr:hypothetical protein BsIDN1_39540 [Bacillus safensis]
MMFRGIRGATTVIEDTETEVLNKTKQLLEAIISRNQVDPERVVQILISATQDIHPFFRQKHFVNLKDGHMYRLLVCRNWTLMAV